MSRVASQQFMVHGLRLWSAFAMDELSGCEALDAEAPGPVAADLELHRAPRRMLPEPSARQWSIRQPRGQSVAHGPWGAVFESYCGSRAWLPGASEDAPVVLRIARARGIAADLFHHTILHGFVPLALALRGYSLVHAACVVCAGRAFLFAGESGMGKSTLAAGFAARGLPVFADDVVRVAPDALGRVHAWPGYPGARLRSNSFLLDPARRAQPPGRYGLPRFRVHTDRIAVAPAEGVPVGGVFFLGRSRQVQPRFERLSPLQALTPWVEASFLLSLPRACRSREAFERMTRLAPAVPAWRLRYRRSGVHFNGLLNELVEEMQRLAQEPTSHGR